jgi:hypothetical protein
MGVVTLELGMKVCNLWKYYFHLTNYKQLLNLNNLGIGCLPIIHKPKSCLSFMDFFSIYN